MPWQKSRSSVDVSGLVDLIHLEPIRDPTGWKVVPAAGIVMLVEFDDRIDEPLLHYSCDSIEEMYGKLGLYTTLAARDLRAKRGRPSLIEVILMPWIVSFKWYVVVGGWRDGIIGVILARYVADSVYQKYLKARWDNLPAPQVEARPQRRAN